MATWYVIDTRSNEIINAIESNNRPEIKADRWVNWEYLIVDSNPPLRLLNNYEFYHGRP